MLRFQLVQRIGKGGSSIVCKCIDRISGMISAVKILEDEHIALAEICKLKSIGHPNIIQILDCFQSDGRVAIVMPMMNMNLTSFIMDIKYQGDVAKEIMRQTTDALDHMHTRGIVHLDVKQDNIGLIYIKDTTIQCRILDLGSALWLDSIENGDSVVTTPTFRAPELMLGVVTTSCDIFSLGMVFKVLNSKITSHGDGIENVWREMVSEDPKDRPNTSDVLLKLGCSGPSVLVSGPFWHFPAADMLYNDLENFVESFRVQKLVTLVCSKSLQSIENAFWLLQEEARRETVLRPSVSVISVLPYFHRKLYFNKLTMYFYARAIGFLSLMPFFFFSEEIRGHMSRVSTLPSCELAVIRVLARSQCTALVVWCCGQGRLWGSRGELFPDFIERHFQDSEQQMDESRLLEVVFV